MQHTDDLNASAVCEFAIENKIVAEFWNNPEPKFLIYFEPA